MEWLAELFETNRIIVLSIYGQVFFVLGLAVALQSRQRSELPLARALVWLAGFGLVHGFMAPHPPSLRLNLGLFHRGPEAA